MGEWSDRGPGHVERGLREMDRQAHGQTNTHMDKHKDRHTDRQMNKHRQTD